MKEWKNVYHITHQRREEKERKVPRTLCNSERERVWGERKKRNKKKTFHFETINTTNVITAADKMRISKHPNHVAGIPRLLDDDVDPSSTCELDRSNRKS